MLKLPLLFLFLFSQNLLAQVYAPNRVSMQKMCFTCGGIGIKIDNKIKCFNNVGLFDYNSSVLAKATAEKKMIDFLPDACLLKIQEPDVDKLKIKVSELETKLLECNSKKAGAVSDEPRALLKKLQELEQRLKSVETGKNGKKGKRI